MYMIMPSQLRQKMSDFKGDPWNITEIIGIGIPNPQSVARMPMPNLTPEQQANIEKIIDKLNELETVEEQEALLKELKDE